jgi:hypothetical protein
MLNKFLQPITKFPYLWKNWKYLRSSPDYLPDPRLVISKHMKWQSSFTDTTTYNGLEPDDYDIGICHTHPVDFDYIKDQCFFYDDKSKMWFSMYYTSTHLDKLTAEIEKINPLAIWTSPRRSVTFRIRKTLIQQDSIREGTKTAVASERLAQMGYYSVLKNKYFTSNEEYLVARVGTARAVLDELELEAEEDFSNEL